MYPIMRDYRRPVKPPLAQQVRDLVADCFSNPRKNAARAARAQYLGELFGATYRDGADVVDREAGQWLCRLRALCAVHADVEDIAHWYKREEARLLTLL